MDFRKVRLFYFKQKKILYVVAIIINLGSVSYSFYSINHSGDQGIPFGKVLDKG
jgi:hypothetical protein